MNTKSTSKSAVIIYNPLAGRGKSQIVAAKAHKHLKQAGWTITANIASEYAGHIENILAPQFGNQVQLIVIIGGDGTLREMVTGLRKSQLETEIAFIPMGNANVVARELNIPLHTDKAIELITSANVKQIDIGVLQQELKEDLVFLAMLEIGFGAKIVTIVDRLRNGALKTLYKIWGDLVYAIAGLVAIRGLNGKPFHTTIDGKPEEIHATYAVIANMQTYAKGWSLTPDAKHDDGLLNTAISQQSSVLAAAITLIAASRKRKLKPHLMKYQTVKQVDISSDNALFIQIDGDPIHFHGHATISIEPAAFAIRVPEK